MVSIDQYDWQGYRGQVMADALLIAAVIVGVAAAGFLVARSPTFWLGLVTLIWSRLWPIIWAVVSKRKSPEQEALDRESYRRGEDKTPGAHGHGGEH